MTSNKKKYEIGERIRIFREKRGLSQHELGNIIGVSNSRVSNWEQGINRPNSDILAELCTALNVSPSSLLGIKVTADEFSEKERSIINAYRAKPEMQHAVCVLLGLKDK